MEILVAQISSDPPPMSLHRPGLPQAMCDAVIHMLAKEPDRRPASIRAAYKMLADAAAQAGVGAADASGRFSSDAIAPASRAALSTGAYMQGAGLDVSRSHAGTTSHVGSGSLPVASPPLIAGAATNPRQSAPEWPSLPASLGASIASPGAPQVIAAVPMHPSHGARTPMGGIAVGTRSGPFAPSTSSKVPWIVAGSLGGLIVVGLVVGLAALLLTRAAAAPSAASPEGSAVDLPAPAAQAGVTIGTTPPAPGTVVRASEDALMKLDIRLAGQDAVMATVSQELGSAQELKVLEANASQVTKAEAKYTRYDAVSQETTQGKAAPAKRTPNAHFLNRTFLVTANGSNVGAADARGGPLTPDFVTFVTGTFSEWLLPRPRVLDRPLREGEVLAPSSSDLALLLGMDGPSAGAIESGKLTFRGTRELLGREVARFDVDATVKLAMQGLSEPLKVTIQGNIDIDVATGWTLQGDVAGPISGSVTQEGIKMDLSGTMTFRRSGGLEIPQR
jgi:hypothetical protein